MRYVCEDCALGFVVEEAYQMHMKVHTKDSGEYECELCHVHLKTSEFLYRHRLRHYRRYRCTVCHSRHKDKESAACHVMTDHQRKTFACHLCEKTFKRPQYLKRHIQQHHTKPLRLECPVCKRVFYERSWYRCHVRTHNAEVRSNMNEQVVTCALCSRDFCNKSRLRRHLMSHTARDVCAICCLNCGNIDALKAHYRQEHSGQVIRSPHDAACPECGRICATKAMLKRHISRMHADRTKKYECDYCHRCYLTKGEVRSHIMWSHMRALGGHACACGRVFRTPARLKDHEHRYHLHLQPARDHACDLCGKAFANKQVLKRHKKSHSDQLYPCTECGAMFKTEPYVKIHYKIKHLNMTRAQIKAQSRQSRLEAAEKLGFNMEPINSPKKRSRVKKKDLVAPTPLFTAFVDVKREILNEPV